MKTQNPLTWVRRHPITAVILSAVLGGLATYAACRPDLLPALAGIYCAMVAIWMAWAWWESRLVSIVLVLALATTPLVAAEAEEEEEASMQAAGGGIFILGGAVIIFGGIAAYYFVKFCQKRFPAVTVPAVEDEDDGEAATEEPEPPPVWVASYIDPEHDYCGLEAASEIDEKLVTITIECLNAPRIRSVKILPASETLTREQFYAQLTRLGNPPGPAPTYSRNGVSCAAEDVPVVLGSDWRWSLQGTAISLECSQDLVVWDSMVTMSAPTNGVIVFSESTTLPRQFYRVSVPNALR